MKRSPEIFLKHILKECDYLLDASKDLNLEEFLKDETLKRSFVRSLEIIGEAVKNIPEDFKRNHPDIEWGKMARMRDKLIHGYFVVDYEIVWDVVKNKIPILKRKIIDIIGEKG